MDNPTPDELLKWWQEEEKFSHTPIGRIVQHLKVELHRLEQEKEYYESFFLRYMERNPHAQETDPR